MTDADEVDAVIVTVRLRSGRFESSIEVPLRCTQRELDAFVEAWLALMIAGINCGQGRREQRGNGETSKPAISV